MPTIAILRRRIALGAAFALCLSGTIAARGPACFAGMVSFTFDDGLSSVYDEAFPLLKKYRYPATIGIVLNRMTSGNKDYMDADTIRELEENGWEVASHGLTHKRPTEIPKFYAEEPIKDWDVDDQAPGVMFQAHYAYEKIAGLLDNGKPMKEIGSIEDVKDSPGTYYFDQMIGQIHIRPFKELRARPFKILPPEKLDIRSISYQREMEESKKGLEKFGFKVDTFLTPYNQWSADLKPICKLYYKQAAEGTQTANFKEKFDPYWLKRFSVSTDCSVELLIRLVRAYAMERDGWVIFCFHGVAEDVGYQPFPIAGLEEIVTFLHDNNIAVVTVAKGASLWKAASAGLPQ